MANPFKQITDPLMARHPDAPDPLYQAWLRTEEAFHGHPTAPGFNDPQILRMGVSETPGNGVPGVPRLRPRPESKGPGIPGPTPSGPTQRNPNYNDILNP